MPENKFYKKIFFAAAKAHVRTFTGPKKFVQLSSNWIGLPQSIFENNHKRNTTALYLNFRMQRNSKIKLEFFFKRKPPILAAATAGMNALDED